MLNEKSRFYGSTKVISVDALKHAFNSTEVSHIEMVLLFGSRALGSAHPRSDYDFAIVSHQDNGWGILAQAWTDIGMLLGLDEVDYDVIDLEQITPEMKKSIKKGYIVLKGDADDISRVLG